MSKERLVFYTQRTMAGTLAIDWGQYEEDSAGQSYDSAHGVPTAAAENTGLDSNYRPFDRTVAAGVQDPSLPSIGTIPNIHFWQQNFILSQVIGGGMSLAHTITGMENRLDFGVHTGLYPVGDEQGRNYVCGLFPGANANEWGWVKWDPLTNVWSHGVETTDKAGGTLTKHTGSRMSPCVAYKGRLIHATGGVVTSFDPSTESFDLQNAYSNGSIIDRPVIASGRLWIVTGGSSSIRVLEVAYGSAFEWLNLGGHAIGAGGDFGVLRFGQGGEPDHSRFYVIFYKDDGGGVRGSKCFRIQTATGSGAPTSTDTSAMVPLAPTGSPPFTVFSEMRYPTGVDQAVWSWESAMDNVDLDPVAVGPWSQSKVMTDPLYEDGAAIPPPYPLTKTFAFAYTSESTRMSLVTPTAITGPVTSHRYSSSSCFLGGDDRRRNANRPKWWLISATAYTDAGVARGLLLKFWGQLDAPGTGGQSVRFVYGRNHQRPNQYATLNGGTPALDYGGTASYNASLVRVDDCDPEDVSGGFTTLLHGAVTAGPFEVGASILGSVSGETAIIQISATGALYLSSVSGPFTPTETITQTNFPNAGANAVVAEQQDGVEHQVIWDLDADGVPDNEWVTIAPYAFRTDSFPAANPTAGDEDVYYSGYALAVLIGFDPNSKTTEEVPVLTTSVVAEATGTTGATPDSTSSAVSELNGDTSATPLSTTSAVSEEVTDTIQTPVTTTGAVTEAITDTSQTPVTTSGGVNEALTDTFCLPQAVGGDGDEPSTAEGYVACLQDGTQNSARPVLNFVTPALPGQALEVSIQSIPDVSFTLDGMVELGRVTVDAVNDAGGTTYPVLDMDALGLTAAGAVELRVVCTAISGLSVQPTVSLGVGGSFDNQLGTTALSLVAADTHERVALLQPRPVLRSGDVLTLQLDGQATATTYVVEVVVYGFQRIPT